MDFARSYIVNPTKLRFYFRLYLVDRLLTFLKFHGYAMPRCVKTYYLDKKIMRKGRDRNTVSSFNNFFSSNPS